MDQAVVCVVVVVVVLDLVGDGAEMLQPGDDHHRGCQAVEDLQPYARQEDEEVQEKQEGQDEEGQEAQESQEG
jgi:hypothetical protein